MFGLMRVVAATLSLLAILAPGTLSAACFKADILNHLFCVGHVHNEASLLS